MFLYFSMLFYTISICFLYNLYVSIFFDWDVDVPANLPGFCEAFLVDYSQERFQAMNKGAGGGSGYG